MNKILLSLLICGSFAFAKQHTTYFHAHVKHSEPVYEYRDNRNHNKKKFNNTRYEITNYGDNYNRYKRNGKQKVLVGYKNYFVYKNREFHKFSNHRKNRIKITETINF